MEGGVESGKKIILFISGSLRKGSYNLQLSRKASSILEEHFECRFLSYERGESENGSRKCKRGMDLHPGVQP